MIRQTPRRNPTDTLFLYPSLFRSHAGLVDDLRLRPQRAIGIDAEADADDQVLGILGAEIEQPVVLDLLADEVLLAHRDRQVRVGRPLGARRSEERRVGKECVRTCRSEWSPYH